MGSPGDDSPYGKPPRTSISKYFSKCGVDPVYVHCSDYYEMDSLETSCLEHIVSNVERFNLAYHTSKNLNVKSKFEFLRRRYSLHLVQWLYFIDCFKEDYLDFLINKHLKQLHSSWIKDFSWHAIDKKISEIGPSLESFTCSGNEKPWENIICHLTNITFFCYDNCNDNILFDIAKFCPKIEGIRIDHSPDVSNDGIKHLCQNHSGECPCPSLKALYIKNTSVDEDGIKYLIQNMPSLKKIDHHRLPDVLYSIHKNNINHLGNVKPMNITKLNLDNVSESPVKNDILKICLSLCPHLQSLSVPVFTQEHLDFCFQLYELKELHLNCLKSPPLAINDSLKLKRNRLTSLTLKNFSVSVSTLTQSCPQLTSLVMDKVTYECNDNDIILLLDNLENISFQKLTMTDCIIAQAVICLLSSSINLKQLEFVDCSGFTAEIKNQILKCCQKCMLKYIDFYSCAVDLEFMENILSTCSSLDDLYWD